MSVALVLSGGGARGAYEVGALSVLLPELERRGERPTIVVGTSVGAFNAAFAAASAHLPAAEALDRGVREWSALSYGDVLEPLASHHELVRGLQYAGQVLGLQRPRVDSLLDPAPLRATLERLVSFRRLRSNVRDGLVTVAVTATSALTRRTIVFHAGGETPQHDPVRGIDYVAAEVGPEHVRASGAIPALFPAVHLGLPRAARGWYYDGGTRLNTPIKPALALGDAAADPVDRVVVIGLNSIAAPPGPLAGDEHPDVFAGAGTLLQALLVDRLTEDMRELAASNEPGSGRRQIRYIFVAPGAHDRVGKVAARVYRSRYAGLRGLLRTRDTALLGRFVAGGDDALHGELLSFLFFAPEFLAELIELGQADARAWLREPRDDGPWQLGPL